MKFTVLMAVYSKESPLFFNAALESIWENQTLKPNQIILVEDGPLSEELYSVISSWKECMCDSLVSVKLPNNVGFACALNEGLKYCSHELIVRMDTDDIALSNRFSEQVRYMYEHSDITACGTFIEEFNGQDIAKVSYPVNCDDIRKFCKLRSPICHPSSAFRKKDILDVGGYPELRLGQDFALWSVLLARGYTLSNIPRVLLKLRTNNEFFNRRGLGSFVYEVAVINLQYREGLISFFDYIKAFVFRSLLRLSPIFMKKLAYKAFRK